MEDPEHVSDMSTPAGDAETSSSQLLLLQDMQDGTSCDLHVAQQEDGDDDYDEGE